MKSFQRRTELEAKTPKQKKVTNVELETAPVGNTPENDDSVDKMEAESEAIPGGAYEVHRFFKGNVFESIRPEEAV